TTEPLVDIPIPEPPNVDLHLYKDAENKIIYECGWNAYIIDVKNKKYSANNWIALGHGFDYERQWNAKYEHIVRHEGKEIGCWPCRAHAACATKGCLTVVYGEVFGRARGVKVWTTEGRKWITIDGWIGDVVGWIEK